MLGLSLSSHASTLFEQLCAFNPNWSKYKTAVPGENERVFLSDKQYIQTHLGFVLEVLRSADVAHLTSKQRTMRTHLITVLSDYRLQGTFPINYYRSERIPVFIDEHGTHCAVGYLMLETGYENLAQQISKADNYVWVKDLKDEQVIEWQQLSGFSLEELKLIQGAYDSYLPFALEAPNYIEIPQKPEVVCLDFRKKEVSETVSGTRTKKIWIRGEGKNGTLHGKWEQNYSTDLPWIAGFYQHGKREGKWLEYYRGTNKLCRTEHWKNDKLNGIRTRFDRNGNVIEEILFENGNAVLKTNYELGQSLKYVRKPLRDSLIWTEVYDLAGNRIASGHETFHNPGNLQWFQNIELTALNTMMLSSQSLESSRITTGRASGFDNSVSLFEEPPLVEYVKQGDWVYKWDASNDYLAARERGESPVSLFVKQFSHFGNEIARGTQVFGIGFGEMNTIPVFDSLQVNYTDGDINAFNGFCAKQRFRMEFEYYTPEESVLLGYYPIRIQHYLFEQRESYHSGTQLKSIGFVNENDEKIKTWRYYDVNGELSRTEEFIKPQKKEIARDYK